MRTETNTCGTPETVFEYTRPPVPSRATDSPPRPVIAALGPSITVGGAGDGCAMAGLAKAATTASASSAIRGDVPCISCRP